MTKKSPPDWKIIGEGSAPTKYSSSSRVRWFRATLLDAANPDRTIVYEFEAPFPVDPGIDYEQWAINALLHALSSNTLKIRDIEPIEE